MTQIRFGILGTGNMAKNFSRDFPKEMGGEITAVASRDRSRAEEFARKHGIPKSYGSCEDLARDPEIDIVYVATPHHLHRTNTILCLDAGRGVLCEKPFTINLQEARDVFEVAQTTGRFLMEAIWTRCLPGIRKLHNVLASGRIGRISMVTAGGGFMPPYDPGHYLFDPHKGGGVLLDAGVYLVHFAQMILGDPDRVAAVGHVSEHGIDDQIAILLGYESGKMATLHVSLRLQSRPEAMVFGEKGKIHIHGPIFNPAGMTITSYDGNSEEIPFDTSRGYGHQVIEAMRCYRQGQMESPLVPWSSTRSVMAIMDEARRQIGLRYPMEQS